jgi:peptidylprolyl isomerase
LKRVPALLGATALVTAALAGCSALPGFGGCDPVYDSGEASSLVSATGDVGTKPTVDFPTPLVVESRTQSTVLQRGDGEVISPGSQVDYDFTILDGKSGDVLGTSGYSADKFSRIAAGFDVSVGEAMTCATVGSRLAIVSAWSDAKGAFSSDAEGSMPDDATVVVVVDLIDSYLGKADGFNQLPQDGMPTVVTAVDGTPGVSVLLQTAPKTTRSSVIKGGDGATLRTDDKAVLHYSLWTWPSSAGTQPAQVGTTWSSHRAVTLGLTDLADGGGVPTGMLHALVGQKVGSQILIVLPPGDDGFPAGKAPAGDDSTYIFVVDILGIQG